MRAERVTDALAEHGEGPVWDADAGVPRWVDMLAGDVLTLEPTATVTRRHIGVRGAPVPTFGG